MNPEYLQFVDIHENFVPHVPAWWDRPRWWLVKMLGGTNPHDTVKVTRIPVNGKTFAERIFRQRRALTESFRREPTTIWMGAEDYQVLMDSDEIRQMFTMYSSFNYGEREMYGLTVHVIPWMRGTLVMPTGWKP